MKRLILASHGSLAKGMKTAVKMIVVNDERIEDYNLDKYDTPLDIKKEVEKEVVKCQDDEFILMTDIKGGSVFNELVKLCVYPNVILVSTMTLPMVLEINMQLDSNESAKELANTIVPLALKTCVILDAEKLQELLCSGEEEILTL